MLEKMNETYVTDLTHFLDETGKIRPDIPGEAREMASFLALIVDAVTTQFPRIGSGVEIRIRCHAAGCQGAIIGALGSRDELVHWRCPACGDGGTISNWQRTRWDNTEL